MADVKTIESAGDFFEMFGIARGFEVEGGALQSRYLELARVTHPDFAGSEAGAQDRAMELAARVNEGYRVLADEELRGRYLLELMGGGGDETALPEGFLERMVELREELEEARARGEAEGVEGRIREIREGIVGRIAGMFREGKMEGVRGELNALRYVTRAGE